MRALCSGARGRRIRFLRVLARSPNPDRLGLGTGGILESIRRGSQPRDAAERKTGRNTGGAGDPDTCPPCVSPLSTPSLDSNRGPCLKGDHQETELTCLLVSGKRHDRFVYVLEHSPGQRNSLALDVGTRVHLSLGRVHQPSDGSPASAPVPLGSILNTATE